MAHNAGRKFDAEDLRQLQSLSKFASAAFQATESLSTGKEFNRSLIDSSPDCIKVFDLQRNLLSMHNGQELLGIEDIRPFLNKSWIAFWEGADRQAAHAAVDAAAAGREAPFVGFFRPLLGEPKWWDIAISPIRDTSGKPVRLLAVSRDVTERKRAETNLEVLAAVTQDLLRFTGVDETMAIMAAKLARILAHRCVPLFTLIEQQAR
ncbi:MAG: PAS domain-containing protein [Pseudomonadota bacterium]|nr:PAS domain-containing protein [Pseudomonadota bacterium]